MPTIKFNDYLKQQLKNPEFKVGYYFESEKLSRAVATMMAHDRILKDRPHKKIL